MKLHFKTNLIITLLSFVIPMACSPFETGGKINPQVDEVKRSSTIEGVSKTVEDKITAGLISNQTPDDFDFIKLAWFYNSPINNDLKSVAENFKTFILTNDYNGEKETLKQMGATTPMIKYLAFFEIQDLTCEEQPWQNNVAYKIGDFCTIEQNHPEWFLYNKNGEKLCVDGFCMMDPGNEEWLNFWLERSIESQATNGWDGIFMDNVEASLDKRLNEEAVPEKYKNDQEYQKAIERALQYFYKAYYQPQGKPLYANIIAVNDWQVWLKYLNYLDGAMIEDFAVDWQDGYQTTDEWEAQMDAIEKAQASRKNMILVSQGIRDDYDREQFALASYLLINNGLSSFRYTNSQVYDEIWLYDNYKINLGVPLGVRYQDGDNWVRNFTHGGVTVNPVTNQSNIILYQDGS